MGRLNPVKAVSAMFPTSIGATLGLKSLFKNPSPNTTTTPVSPQDLLNAKISAQIAPIMMMLAASKMPGNSDTFAQGVSAGEQAGAGAASAAGVSAGSPQIMEMMMKSLSGKSTPKSNYDIANMFYGKQFQEPTPEMKSGGGPNMFDKLNSAAKVADVFAKLKGSFPMPQSSSNDWSGSSDDMFLNNRP